MYLVGLCRNGIDVVLVKSLSLFQSLFSEPLTPIRFLSYELFKDAFIFERINYQALIYICLIIITQIFIQDNLSVLLKGTVTKRVL